MKYKSSIETKILTTGILLLLSSVLVSFLPVSHEQKITETRVTKENNYVFSSGGVPEELSVSFGLDPLSKQKGEIFRTASYSHKSLICFQNLTVIYCDSSGKKLSINLKGMPKPTIVKVDVLDHGKLISLESFNQKSTLVLNDAVEVTNLRFDLSQIENAEFQLREMSMHSSWSTLQKIVFYFSIFLTGIVFYCFRLLGVRQNRASQNQRKSVGFLKVNKSDLVAFSAILLSWLLSYPGFDDGWFRSIQNAQRTTGEFVSYFGGYPELRDVPYPLGTMWNYVMQNLSSSFRITLLSTFVNVVIWAIAWILISRFIVLPWKDQASYRLISALVFTLFVLESGMSLRPEPFITLLLIAVMAIPSMPWRMVELKISVITLFGLLALITYPTGIGVFLASLISVIYLAMTSKVNIKLLFVGIITASGISVQTLLIGSNIFESFELFTTFANGDLSHSGSPYTEYQRIENVFSMWGGQTQILLLLAYFSFLVLSISLISILGNLERSEKSHLVIVLHLQSLAVFIGLLATPSKWGWHLLVTLPAVIVAMLVVDSYIAIKRNSQARLLFSISFFVTGSALIYLKGGYGAEELHFGALAQRVLLLEPNSNVLRSSVLPWWAWILLGVIVFELTRRLLPSLFGPSGKHPKRSAVSLALIPILLVPGTQFVAPGVLNLFDSGWNFNKQQVFGVSNEKLRCGIPSNTALVVSATPLSPVNYHFENRSSRNAADKFAKLVPAQAAHPPLGKQSTFWLENNYVEKSGTQVFYKPNGVSEIGFWITSDEFENRIVRSKAARSTFLIEYIGENGETSSKRFTPGTADYWHLVSLKTDKSAGEVKVTIQPSKDFRYLALSPVASIYRVNALKHLTNSNSTLLVDPTTALFSPCTVQPMIKDGTWQIPDYALGTRSRDVPPFDANSPKYQLEMSFVEVGCPRKINSQARTQQCLYRISK